MVSTIKFIICVSLVVIAIILSHFVFFPLFIQASNCDILIAGFDNSPIEKIIGDGNFTLNHYWDLPAYECSKFFDKDLVIEELLRFQND